MVLGIAEGLSSVSSHQLSKVMGTIVEDVEVPNVDLVRLKRKAGGVGLWEGILFPAPKPRKSNSGARKALAKRLISRSSPQLNDRRVRDGCFRYVHDESN